MDDRQQRAYAALRIGPIWQRRQPAAGQGDFGDAQVRSGAVPAAGDVPLAMRADVGDDGTGSVVEPPIGGTGEFESSPSLPQASGGSSAAPPQTEPAAVGALDWAALRQCVASCTACALGSSRTQTVFGVGPVSARWMLVGEAPGAEEDRLGEPFVGKAGRLLDNMLSAVGLNRDRDVYIANVLKCRPPRNRDPLPDEVARCEPYLKRQIELLSPDLVLVMGRFAAQTLLGTEASIASLRGRLHGITVGGRRVPVVVTYHPAYLLRNLHDKAKSWADLLYARRVFAERAGRTDEPPAS
jgi:DNA polymerase